MSESYRGVRGSRRGVRVIERGDFCANEREWVWCGMESGKGVKLGVVCERVRVGGKLRGVS